MFTFSDYHELERHNNIPNFNYLYTSTLVNDRVLPVRLLSSTI